jgi:HCOMODA/2-hydroxy-3-carboxy-muconic semialdehyde decarboxylase
LLVTPRWAETQTAPASAGPVNPVLIEDLVAANRVLVDKGVIDIRGHVSVRHPRDPNRFLMSRAVAPELVTAGDILEHDLDGQALDAKGRNLFAERFIHSEIYRARPDVMAVVHAHTPSAVAFSVTDIPLRPLIISANFIGEGAPVFQNGEYGAGIGRPELGQALAQKLGKGPAVLMRGHGMVVVGSSLSAAVGRSVYLDVNAQIQSRALAMGGKPIYNLPPEKVVTAVNPYDREWEAWKRKVGAAGNGPLPKNLSQ